MRIIAGEFKGRRIDAPKGSDTRPTLDRVKESLFGIIQFELYGRTVLDLFAGSGSLGIEAMSRGARLVVFNDASSECARLIRQNLEKLHASSAFEVFARDGLDLLTTLERRQAQFDIVFLDPPYASGLAQHALDKLFSSSLLSDGAIVVVEHDVDNAAACPSNARLRTRKRYGTVLISIFEKEMPQNECIAARKL